MRRGCIIAVKRNVLERVFFHADGAFSTVIQSHELHPSPMYSPVQHEFDSAGPLAHATLT